MKILPRTFYNRDAQTVAKDLLGKYLVHRMQDIEYIGKIVEVEAYLGPHDLAAHSAKGLTERTKVMFGPPGYAYVYMIYGIHYCMNVVTEENNASAVLIRAIEPIKNITHRTQGPGLVCKAMHIDKSLNAQDLLSPHFHLCEGCETSAFTIVKRPRIGIDYAGHWAKRLLRFYIKDSAFISKR